MLNIAQSLLDFLDHLLVTRVLAHVITELHSRTAICASDLDDDVQGLGFLAV